MESNSGQGRIDQMGGPLEGISEQNTNMPANNDEMESVIYADLGLERGGPDVMNPGDEEASDTILYTDNVVARDATDGVAGNIDDELTANLTDDDLDRLSDGDDDVDVDPDVLKAERDNDDGKDRYLAY